MPSWPPSDEVGIAQDAPIWPLLVRIYRDHLSPFQAQFTSHLIKYLWSDITKEDKEGEGLVKEEEVEI